MRTDGDFTIYLLEGRSRKPKSKEEWFIPSFDHFGTPPGFSSSDPCWQKLGIHATFDYKQAAAALQLFHDFHVEYDWRLMRRKISQQTSELILMAAEQPGKESPNTHSYPRHSDYELGRRASAIYNGGKTCQCLKPKLSVFYNCEKCELPSRFPVPGWQED